MGLKIRVLGLVKKVIKRVFSRKPRQKKGTKKPKIINQDLQDLPQIPQKLLPEIKAFRAIDEFSQIQLSKHTARAYRNDLNDFFAFLKVKDQFENWNNFLGPQQIAEYRDYLVAEKALAKGSVTRKIAVLKSFFKYGVALGWLDRNPAELIKTFPQTQESKTGFLMDSEVDALLLRVSWATDRLSHQLAKVVIETLLMLGLRRSEACAIRLGDIEFTDATWLVRISGKGDRQRLLPIPVRLQHTWAFWLKRICEDVPLSENLSEAPGEWLRFFERNPEQPLLISTRAMNYQKALSDSELARIVRKWSKKAGLINRVSPHMLRATAITHALDQGASHRGVQQMAGWTSPLMITRYDKRKKDPKFSGIHHIKYAKEVKESSEDNSKKEYSVLLEPTAPA